MATFFRNCLMLTDVATMTRVSPDSLLESSRIITFYIAKVPDRRQRYRKDTMAPMSPVSIHYFVAIHLMKTADNYSCSESLNEKCFRCFRVSDAKSIEKISKEQLSIAKSFNNLRFVIDSHVHFIEFFSGFL